MSLYVLLVSMALIVMAAFILGQGRARAQAESQKLHSLPQYYGLFAAMWCMVPGLLLVSIWAIYERDVIEALVISHLPQDLAELPQAELSLILNQVYNIAYDANAGLAPDFMLRAATAVTELERSSLWLRSYLVLGSMIVVAAALWLCIRPKMRASAHIEGVFSTLLMVCSLVAVFTTIGIFASMIFESLRFFQLVPLGEFLFGFDWTPLGSVDPETTKAEGKFGAIPLFLGTAVIALIAMIIAVPVGLYAAVYLSEYASARFRNIIKPALEILAGVPTLVYGFFAALTVAPLVGDMARFVGLDQWLQVSSESALAASAVMGLMLVPFISSLSDDVFRAVPKSLRDGSLALGATRSETVKHVIVPAAMPGIASGVLLAASRAVGETMIVVMAAGLAAKFSLNPLDSLTTVTVQIVTLLSGDQEFESPKTLAAFALGLMLFIVTLSLNVCALRVVKRARRVKV